MRRETITLIGVPADHGSRRGGCLMGPDALRTAGLAATLEGLGYHVADAGNLNIAPGAEIAHENTRVHHLADYAALIETLDRYCALHLAHDEIPLFMGGDHSIAAGFLPALARRAKAEGREQFVLWLDAHTDFQTLHSTDSGNLHGTPLAYATGQPGFEGALPAPKVPIPEQNVCMLGIRSVDPSERASIANTAIDVHDMRRIDETGMAAPLRAFLERVEEADGHLHVSLDIDFLDPAIAPAVGTTVAGGASFREAHLIMEMLYESGRVTSLDISELNPFLDEEGRTSLFVNDLIASLFGRQVLARNQRRASA